MRRIQHIVRGQKGKELPGDSNGVRIILRHEMNIAADAGIGRRAADFIHRAFLPRHRLNHFRPADKHVGAPFTMMMKSIKAGE